MKNKQENVLFEAEMLGGEIELARRLAERAKENGMNMERRFYEHCYQALIHKQVGNYQTAIDLSRHIAELQRWKKVGLLAIGVAVIAMTLLLFFVIKYQII